MDTLSVASIHVSIAVATLDIAVKILNTLPDLETPASLSGSQGRLSLSIKLEGKGPGPGAALQSSRERLEEVMEVFREAGVDPSAVRTDYHMSRRISRSTYEREEPRQEYRAYSTAEVTLDSLALLTRAIDAV